jgi:hypothetical protein
MLAGATTFNGFVKGDLGGALTKQSFVCLQKDRFFV